MKTSHCVMAILALVGLMLAGCSDQQQSPISPVCSNVPGSLQKVETLQYTGYDFPVALIDPGNVREEGGKRITQHLLIQERLMTTTPLITGTMDDDICLRVDIATGEGSFNGKGTVTPDDPSVGGVWHWSAHGQTVRTGESEWTTSMDLVGHGQGGRIQGMQLFARGTLISVSNPPAGWAGTVEGYIKSNAN